jgi:hypothetical protein
MPASPSLSSTLVAILDEPVPAGFFGDHELVDHARDADRVDCFEGNAASSCAS